MTDEERKAIEQLKVLIGLEEYNKLSYIENKAIQTALNLINKQEKAIDRMSKYIEEITGSCPLDREDFNNIDCDNKCYHGKEQECWKEYFMEDKE